MTVNFKSAAAVASFATSVVAHDVHQSGQTAAPMVVLIEEDDEVFHSLETSEDPSFTEGSLEITAEAETEWGHEDERHFHNLAVREAVGEINDTEQIELEKLSAKRRAAKTAPASPEEVLHQLEQWRRINAVLDSVRRYIEILPPEARGASKAEAKAKG